MPPGSGPLEDALPTQQDERESGDTRNRAAVAVLTAALDAVVVIDARGTVVEWNGAAVEMFGFSRSDAIGCELAELIVPDDLQAAHRAALRRVEREGTSSQLGKRLELPARRADGSMLLVELTISRADIDGETLFTGWLRDVTEIREVQAQLRRSEERLSALIAHVSDIVTVLGGDGSWVSSSPAGGRLLGYPEGYDLPGGVFALLHPDDVDLAQRALAEVLDGTRGPDEPVELRVQTVTGDYRVLETVGEDLRDNPAVGGVVLTSHDVTDRLLQEDRVRRLAAYLGALVENLRDGVLFVDGESRITAVNRAFTELWGYEIDADSLRGRGVAELRAHAGERVADPEWFTRRVVQLYAEETMAVGDRIPMRDGRVLERDHIPIPLGPGEHGHLWLYRDVTERERTQQLRAQALSQERAARLATEAQNRSLQELDELKNQLVASVSHELRTPLTAIYGFAQLLEADAAQLSERHREFLAGIRRNTDRLLGLVSDLLLLATLESRTVSVELSRADVADLLRDCVGAVRSIADEAGHAIEVDVEAGPPLVADIGRIEQLLANLLSNACKYTPAGGHIAVRAARGDGQWRISVSDTGIGVPERDLSALGTRFFRASNTAGTTGTGLGLSICAAIARLHDGDLSIESRLGEGTTVTVRIPDRAVEER